MRVALLVAGEAAPAAARQSAMEQPQRDHNPKFSKRRGNAPGIHRQGQERQAVNGRDDLAAGWHDEQQIANSRMELLLVGQEDKQRLSRQAIAAITEHGSVPTGDCLLLTGVGAREWKQAPR